MKRQEKTVLILGDGEHAKKLLFHGLLVNVFDADHRVQYHAFGNWDAFRNDHHRMSLTIAIDQDTADMDQVYFHKDSWNTDPDLLYRADRIVICGENHEENLAVLRKLRRYHATSGAIHLRFDSPIPGETVFGTIQQIYSEELVLQERLTWAAKSMHQLYCNGSKDKTPAWEELTPFQCQSNLSAADHLLTKIRLLLDDETIIRVTPENCQRAYLRYCQQKETDFDRFRQIEHLRWMRFYSLYNWQYGPQRDNTARIHPMLLPYDQLSETEQRKDDHAWELLKPLSEVIS